MADTLNERGYNQFFNVSTVHLDMQSIFSSADTHTNLCFISIQVLVTYQVWLMLLPLRLSDEDGQCQESFLNTPHSFFTKETEFISNDQIAHCAFCCVLAIVLTVTALNAADVPTLLPSYKTTT